MVPVCCIIACAWYDPSLSDGFVRGESTDLWGRVMGTPYIKVPPEDTQVLERIWQAGFEKGREPAFETIQSKCGMLKAMYLPTLFAKTMFCDAARFQPRPHSDVAISDTPRQWRRDLRHTHNDVAFQTVTPRSQTRTDSDAAISDTSRVTCHFRQ